MKTSLFRKYLGLFVVAVILLGAVSAYAAPKGPGIALITSAAGPNDKGYNESAIIGLQKIKEQYGINYNVVESQDIPGSLALLAEAGYELIFSLEYNFDALIDGVGGRKPIAEQFPNTTFVIFNDNPNLNPDGTVKHQNVISVLFDVHEASFWRGVERPG